jgi:ATP synthase protein I
MADQAGRPVSGGGTPAGRDPGPGEGWAVLSYLIAGMALYGLVGWLVGRWTSVPVLFPVGMLFGLASALALIIFRFTRS